MTESVALDVPTIGPRFNPPSTTPVSSWHALMRELPSQPKAGAPALDGNKNPIAGSLFEKRLLTHIDHIYRGPNPARAESITEVRNAQLITTSFSERGFVPSDAGEGLIVVRIPDSERRDKRSPKYGKEFELIAGYHRFGAHDTLREKDSFWEYVILDIYEYDTRLARETHAGATNCHYEYRSSANLNDIKSQIDRGLREQYLPLHDDAALESFVNAIAAHLPSKTRRAIISRAQKWIPAQLANGQSLASLSSNLSDKDKLNDKHSTHRQAIAQDLPVQFGSGPTRTAKPNSHGDIQTYFTDEGSIQKALMGMPAWAAAGAPVDKFVFAALYVNTLDLKNTHRNPLALQELRKKQWDKAHAQLEAHYKVMILQHQRMFATLGLPEVPESTLRDLVVRNCPIVIAGFLPQVESPDASKGGNAMETTMVDWQGLPYEYRARQAR